MVWDEASFKHLFQCKEEFNKLIKQGYNRIPIIREVLADLDTPLSAYLKLKTGPYSYLFESVQGGEKWGRYSIIGLSSQTVVRVYNNNITISTDKTKVEQIQTQDPFAWLLTFLNSFKVPEFNLLSQLRFSGGLVGYFGYETVHFIEPRLRQTIRRPEKKEKEDELKTPDILLMVSDEVVVFDNLMGKFYLIIHITPAQTLAYANQRLDTLVSQLRQPTPYLALTIEQQSLSEDSFQTNFPRTAFEQAVDQAKTYIKEGDIMQVVLSQRLKLPFTAPPIDFYRALRYLNPSPYLYYLDLDDFYIVGSSPEILVQKQGSQITLRPIAGTRPRGNNKAQDLALEQELLADAKERAEHLMLIDLGRNDVGRVAQTGTVKVTDKMIIERYSHVMHIVSQVIGHLKPNLNVIDVLRATFPAGTLSGAPKIRAMEIIQELEPHKRGIYGGAIGYLTWHGDIDTAIAIRTAVISKQTLYIQVGAGIVADSVPANEWNETMNKGRALFKAATLNLGLSH